MVSANDLRMQKQMNHIAAQQIAWLWRDIATSQNEDQFACIERDLIKIIMCANRFSDPARRIVEIERAVSASRVLNGKVREEAVAPWREAVSELPSVHSKIDAAKRVLGRSTEPFSWLQRAARKVILNAAPMIHDPMERLDVLKIGCSGFTSQAEREQYAREFLALASVFQNPKPQLDAAYLAMIAASGPGSFNYGPFFFAGYMGEMAAEIVLANIHAAKPERRANILDTAWRSVDTQSHVGVKIDRHRRLLAIEQKRQTARTSR